MGGGERTPEARDNPVIRAGGSRNRRGRSIVCKKRTACIDASRIVLVRLPHFFSNSPERIPSSKLDFAKDDYLRKARRRKGDFRTEVREYILAISKSRNNNT
ncbi:hypothetical protein TNIN_426521 [Trichonephila inaurata madagascariensis]|uniref:Uncharacterized protein n=1 Tax=Trichonephila inaurata madagascariensis TaxID=2747483 RepID=A0A8X6XF23_9ARAC|nr:hypothetical protein TNIN_426521 [Trichonephila inaurata madagascariensis]